MNIFNLSAFTRNGIKYFVMFMVLVTLLFLCNIESAKASDVSKFPTKAIHIIIPGSAGGSNDREMRTLAPFLAKILGVRFDIDYVPGAEGMIAYNTDLFANVSTRLFLGKLMQGWKKDKG